PGNPLQEFDLNVNNTMIKQGNYDYLTNSIVWDPNISDHSIPNSYFRTSKPSFFGSLTWPPFDPANPPGAFNDTNISRIPAGYRYVHGIDPPGVSAPSTYILSVSKTGTGSGTVTCSGVTCPASVAPGSSVTLTAAAVSGSVFGGWSGGSCSGTNPVCTLTMNSNATVIATFTSTSADQNPITYPVPTGGGGGGGGGAPTALAISNISVT